MITPLFECEQDERVVRVRVRAPHSRPRDVEIHADGARFSFFCRPYLLQLRFPAGVRLPEDQGCVTYDIETGIAEVVLEKESLGVHFERLDMLSSLLLGRATGPVAPGPGIEVLSSVEDETAEAYDERVEACEDEDAREAVEAKSVLFTDVSKQFCTDVADVGGIGVALRELSVSRPRYGFAARYEGVFSVRAEDIAELVELEDPDNTPVWRRSQLRSAAENAKFDPEHYVADFILADEFSHVMDWKRPTELAPLSDYDKDVLLKLPRREYLADADSGAVADLAAVLYAACYDERTTLGEANVESAWTLSRVCPVFAFLDPMPDPASAITAAYRRSLAYPLYRNRALADLVLVDLKDIFEGSSIDVLRARLLRILLRVRCAFEDDRLLRIFNDLFLTDYCVWVQSVANSVLERLTVTVRAATVPTEAIGWDLGELERDALATAAGLTEEGECFDDMQGYYARPGDVPSAEEGYASYGTRDSPPPPQVQITAAQMPGIEMVPVSTRALKRKVESVSSSSDESSSDASSNESVSDEDDAHRMLAPDGDREVIA